MHFIIWKDSALPLQIYKSMHHSQDILGNTYICAWIHIKKTLVNYIWDTKRTLSSDPYFMHLILEYEHKLSLKKYLLIYCHVVAVKHPQTYS